MKAIVCDAPGRLLVEDRDPPSPAANEAVVRIRRVGLCGTDYHIFEGNQPFLSYPRVMGHELAGEIVSAPDGSGLTPGTAVTINPYLPCRTCHACAIGKPNCCTQVRVLGVHIDGGMREWIAVPIEAIIPVPGLTLDQAAMIEFLAIGAHAVRRGATRKGQRVLVVGAGPIGIAAALFAGIEGAEVTLVDRSEQRLVYARDALGIADTIVADDALAAKLGERTNGDFFDIVFDATGNARAMEAGFAFVAHGGSYVLISVVKDEIRFADPEFHKREMTLIGSRNALRADFEHVITKIGDGTVSTDRLHTHSFPLLDLPDQMQALRETHDRILKAIGHF